TSNTHQVEIGFTNNQLDVKASGISILIPAEVFKAQTNKWYPIAVTCDGNTLRVYVEGKEVGSKTANTNSRIYVKDLWFAGANELLREVRLWKRALTQKEIQIQLWSTLKPTNDLLLYYPLNGKKYNKTSNTITDDETKLWDWSPTGTSMELPSGATFNNGTGYGIVFPPR
ncbi:MAG: LamG-like jellyroll fold domain-containing protein, partial [Capnocytophaga ochracea]